MKICAQAAVWFCLLSLAAQALGKLTFDEIGYANTNVEMHQVLFTESVDVDQEEIPTGYKTLIRSGEKDPRGSDAILGLVLDQDGKPLDKINEVPDAYLNRNGRNESVVDVSHSPDFVSMLPRGDKVFLLAHFEAPNPGSSYLIEAEQDENGELSVVGFEPVDWSELGGLWTPCAGSVTPWVTHLGSEEFSPDARQMDIEDMEEWDLLRNNTENSTPRNTEEMMRYFGVYPDELTPEDLSAFNPYMYGYPWEFDVMEDGEYTIVKHMAMGRTSIELPYVMPDNKTVYITDDGQNRVFTMFVADKEKDLSCGELYAAKAEQLDDDAGGLFDITWIQLGDSICESELMEKAATLRFADIFSVQEPKNTTDVKEMCKDGYEPVNTDVNWECLKLMPEMEMYASRFETRRYAALMGATTEWNKWEGFTYSPKRRKAFIAMSSIEKGMEDFMKRGAENDKYDIGGNNDVRLAYNPCGCVYAMDVDDNLWITKMYTLTCGTVVGGDDDNKCDVDGIASPDNLSMIDEHNGLLVGEDTKYHRNDVIWYLDLNTGEMSRIFSTPYGSETTGPYWHADINGWSYMMAVVQHPYGESDKDKRWEDTATGVEGWIGYIGPLDASLSVETS